jgi:hypothetical protein
MKLDKFAHPLNVKFIKSTMLKYIRLRSFSSQTDFTWRDISKFGKISIIKDKIQKDAISLNVLTIILFKHAKKHLNISTFSIIYLY